VTNSEASTSVEALLPRTRDEFETAEDYVAYFFKVSLFFWRLWFDSLFDSKFWMNGKEILTSDLTFSSVLANGKMRLQSRSKLKNISILSLEILNGEKFHKIS
jgi:hypothetical protein